MDKQTQLEQVKTKQKDQYLNLELGQNYHKSGLLLNTTGLELISRQEKIMFTTGSFKNTFSMKITPMEFYFMFSLEVPKNHIRLISIIMGQHSDLWLPSEWKLKCSRHACSEHWSLIPLQRYQRSVFRRQIRRIKICTWRPASRNVAIFRS